MKLKCLWRSGRAACVLIADGGAYHTRETYQMTLNGRDIGTTDRCVTSLYDLLPNTAYTLTLSLGGRLEGKCIFSTRTESVTLDVRAFGAVGDGVSDDTPALQAAIACCPKDGRVLIPKGRYLTSPLFVKSGLRLELAQGAELCLNPDKRRLPILPGRTENTDERGETLLGTWEGNPLSCYAALLTGVEVKDVDVYGRGTLNGQAALGDWWQSPKQKRGAWRGRMLYLCRCQNVTLQGVRVQDSPSWNLHPYFSRKVALLDLQISAPPNSPNTDGIDPESCADVLIAGVRFHVGDDCIAIKSGKRYMGMTYRTPCERLEIMHCLMEKGHGGVTVGSEMSGGVRDVRVHDCEMIDTDRGLRIKTRRGRGESAVVDGIRMERVRMNGVRVPFCVNCFYYCDPDGHAPEVQDRAPRPVDDGTPGIGTLSLCDIDVTGCTACAGYCLGLPESKIARVEITSMRVQYADGEPFAPVMADGVEPCVRAGLVMENVEVLTLDRVTLCGAKGDALTSRNVDAIVGDVENR